MLARSECVGIDSSFWILLVYIRNLEVFKVVVEALGTTL